MKRKFKVCLSRDVTEQCVVTVEAEDVHEAMSLAYDEAEERLWEHTDWQGDTHYEVKEVQ